MDSEKLYEKYIDKNWRSKLSRLVFMGKKQQALKLLDRFAENILPLFMNNPDVLEERRIAWLLRIELLKKWDRKIEALAWVCLECELNPENLKAQIFKEQLKNELNLNKDNAVDNSLENYYLPSTDWEGIAGMQELKTILEMDVINPIKNPAIYRRYKVSIPNGLLFYGPPGCGKTYIARKFADKIKYNFIEITPSDVASMYVHGTQQKIGELFKDAAEKAPTILFFDEFDAFAPSREDSSTGYHYRSEVNEFLTQLNECHEKRILVIGATNNPKLIDSAVLRPGRLDIKVYIPPPDFEARVEVFKMYMDERPQEKLDFIRLAEYTELYTYAEIKNIVELTARKAAHGRKNITTDNIIEQIIANPPSLTEEKVEKMRKWKE